MCGIVGLFLKNPDLRPQLGEHLSTMLIGMTDRGPDSAGIAVYHKPVTGDRCKLTLFHAEPASPLARDRRADGRGSRLRGGYRGKSNHAVVTVATDEAHARQWLKSHHPEVRVMGYGQLMEVYKDMGLPAAVVDKYGIRGMEGTHAIGHTRMATESAVTTDGAHPFSTGPDQCLVHNGSLSQPQRAAPRAARGAA